MFGAWIRKSGTIGSDPVLEIAREVARIASAKLRQPPITASDHLAAFWGSAGTFHALSWIAVDHRVVDRQLGSGRDVMHCDERDLTSDPDVRSTRMVQAQDVAFDLCGGARCNVEVVLYLNLCRRHLSSDEREFGKVHDGATFDGDDLSSRDWMPREQAAARDGARALLRLLAEPATHRSLSPR